MSSVNVEDCICPICQEILIEPVLLPCMHKACLDCLEKTLDNNKYQCFLCRKFIGSWYRNSKRKNQLIHEKLWKTIQTQFADLVEKRLNGESVDMVVTTNVPLVLSSPGEIKREFDIYMEKIQNEDVAQRQKEEMLSAELIEKIQEEERNQLRQQEELSLRDVEFAKILSVELNSNMVSTRNNSKIPFIDEQIDTALEPELENTHSNDDKVSFNREIEIQLDMDEKLAKQLVDYEEKYKILNEQENNIQIQLEKDEQYARKLAAELEQRSQLRSKNFQMPMKVTGLKTHQKRVSIGPMDRFLARKQKTNY